MKKIIYTRPDGGISVVIPAPKDRLELVLGPLTDEQYEAHVWERSVPADATNARQIEESDLPADREFRHAWVDVTASSIIDIDLGKAKDLKLEALRKERNIELDKLDRDFMVALEKGGDLEPIKAKKQALRDVTEPLKALEAEGHNDSDVLQKIRDLSVLSIK